MQLENRQRRFGLWLLKLPQVEQARKVLGAPTAIGLRLTNALAYWGREESIVLLQEPETLDGKLLQEGNAKAKGEAEKARPGLSVFTDGWRMGEGAAATLWSGRMTSPGPASKPTWVTTRRLTGICFEEKHGPG